MDFLRSEFRKTQIKNGPLVITEHYPQLHAVALGFGVRAGSSHETSKQIGITHFLEHLVFKGTKKYSAFDIVAKIESTGGDINAYTSREMTCFHTMSLTSDVDICVDVIMDLIFQAKLEEDEVDKERKVILQELAMTMDVPEEYIFDLFFENMYKDTPLGFPILGTPKTLSQISQNDVKKYYEENYGSDNLVVCAVGNIDHDHLVKLVSQYEFRKVKEVKTSNSKVAFNSELQVLKKESEQSHLLLGIPAHSLTDGRFYEATIINAYLGGGMTSRLYQELREKQALCYSVYSSYYPFESTGCFAFYAGLEAEKCAQALKMIRTELEQLNTNAISQTIIDSYKKQVQSSLLLNYDDIDSRMNQLLMDSFAQRDYCSLEEHLRGLENVNCDSVQDYVSRYFSMDSLALNVVGNLSEEQSLKLKEVYEG